jgi:two-component system, cell cycle response regulator
VSLQRRLTTFFFVVVFVPLIVGGIVVVRVIGGEIAERRKIVLPPSLQSAIAVINERSESLDGRLREIAEIDDQQLSDALAADSEGRLERLLRIQLRDAEDLDFLGVVDPERNILGYEQNEPEFLASFTPREQNDIAAGGPLGPGYVRSGVPLEVGGDGPDLMLMGGFWVDQAFLESRGLQDAELTLVDGRQIIASTADLGGTTTMNVDFSSDFDVELAEPAAAAAERIQGDFAIVATADASAVGGGATTNVILSMIAVGVLALISTALLARLLANLVIHPIKELADRTGLIPEGRYEPLPVTDKGEVGQLSHAFNEMAQELELKIKELQDSRDDLEKSNAQLEQSRDELQASRDELEASRDQMRRAIHRVGETLRSTHNMSQIRESIVDTAADAVKADAAVMWSFNHTREELIPSYARGIDGRKLGRIMVGKGVTGLVAERRGTVVLPDGSGGPSPAQGEPPHEFVIATPVLTEDLTNAVLAMYRHDGEFDEGDVETVKFLAEQGGVAMENVMLHEDARRLSLTDGLTGVWNLRYLKMQFPQILATASRFGRNFSVLMLDLDNFKNVNDTFGHQRGDAVLIEFSKRVGETLREVDHFIRYGGEEFLCLLTETGLSGAKAAADKILLAVRSDTFGSPGEDPVDLTVSIGVASYPEHGGSYERLISAADGALYRAKQEGRDRWRVADGSSPGLRLA